MARITQQLRALWYSKVFSLVLKTVIDVQVRMSAGIKFHRCDAANEKAHLAKVVVHATVMWCDVMYCMVFNTLLEINGLIHN